MDALAPTSPPTVPSPQRRWRRIVLLLLVLSLIGGGIWWRWLRGSPSDTKSAPDDPRLTFSTPFLNVRPEVQYVGDAACAKCHQGRSETYHEHPMGRSLAPPLDERVSKLLGPDGRVSFRNGGATYIIERRGDQLFHREIVKGPKGETIIEREAEARYTLGSGTRGLGFLIGDNGYLFQSPISRYNRKGLWDLSPGYESMNEHFDRPIIPGCLFCHANRVEPVEGTVNRYQEPIFRGESIGCERCHGPGELHVRRQREKKTEPGEDDYTIVNPRHLEPKLREAICQQCHLQGLGRVLRRGRADFDYRPGLPMYLFWSVFEMAPELDAETKAVGQVEQMHTSQCYQKTQGELVCSSCHDAHRLPSKTEKISYYRRRCLECHEQRYKPCNFPQEARLAKQDDCAACHMPPLASTDIAHTAASDHRILRDPSQEPKSQQSTSPPKIPVVHFHRDLLSPDERETWVRRDMGVAMMKMAAQTGEETKRVMFSQLALSMLEDALKADPDDLPAWGGLALAQRYTGRPAKALGTYESILEREPKNERMLVETAELAAHLGGIDRAIGYWHRAIAVNPYRWQYHQQLALLLRKQHQTAQALDAYEAGLKLNPLSVALRTEQVGCLIDLKRLEQARAAFEKLLALKPPNEEQLRLQFEALLQ